jgi:hypothetical protein
MAYDTGSATGPTQILDAFRVFAVANGWTQNRWAADGAGQTLSISKGSIYANLRSIVNETLLSFNNRTGVLLNCSTGYDSGQPWTNQPGKCQRTNGTAVAVGAIGVTSSNTYHLFAASSPDLLVLVIEVSPGQFTWLHFGDLTKFGSWNGGILFGGKDCIDSFNNVVVTENLCPTGGHQFASALIHAEVDGSLLWRTVIARDSAFWITGYQAFGGFSNLHGSFTDTHYGFAGEWSIAAPNQLNGVTPMIPMYVFAPRPSNYRSPLGYLPHLCYMRIDNYAPGETFSLGSEQWMAFPTISKGGASGMNGFAVRKNG